MINDFDTIILRFFTKLQTPGWLDSIILFWTDNIRIVLVRVIIILLFFKKTRKSAWIAFLAIYLSPILVDEILKDSFRRIRPYEIYEWAKLIGRPAATFSFPSGHSSFAFAAATGLSFYKKRSIQIGVFAMAAFTAFTRVYIGVHWTTDVLAGAVSGILCGWAAYYVVNLIIELWRIVFRNNILRNNRWKR